MDQAPPSDGLPADAAASIERPIGREPELGRLRSLLRAPSCRLITLTGTAGVGKTRLAFQAAEDERGEFAGGVVVVELAAVRNPELVVGEIARALGVREGPDPLIERVARRLRGQRTLLVLDNFEHLLPAAPEIDGLLGRCPEAVALVTSRTPLLATGEEVVAVQPLALPNSATAQVDPWHAASIRLFVRRAEAAGAAIARSDEHARAVAGICRRLDGLPLAIELAATYAPVLPLSTLLGLLERRLPLLTDPRRPGPDRLRTMRDAIAWSYELLPELHQTLFRRLAVFDGGFTRAAATALVAGWQLEDGYPFVGGQASPYQPVASLYGKEGPDHPAWRPEPLPRLDLDRDEGLEGLVRHNLLRVGIGPDGEARYGMLETIREFGLEQLVARGEEAGVRHAHAAYMLGFAEAASAPSQTAEHLAWLARAEADLGNIRSALAWLEAAGEPANQLLLRMSDAFGAIWQTHGRRSEPRHWLDLALSRQTGSPAARADALIMTGTLAWIQGDDTRASAVLEESLPLCLDLHYLWGAARAHFFLALVAWRRGQFDQMVARLPEALRLHHASGDQLGVGLCQIGLGILARGRQDVAGAAELLEEAYGRMREGRNDWGAATARFYGGSVALDRGDVARAIGYWREALDLYLVHDDPWGAGGCLAALAAVAATAEQAELAARLLGIGDALIERGDAFMPPTELLSYRAAATAVRAKLGDRAFGAAYAEGATWSVPQAVAAARTVRPTSATDGPPSPTGKAAGDSPAIPQATLDGAGHGLTDLQIEIVRRLADDQSPKEIADATGMSQSWIYAQITRIKMAWGVHGPAGLVRRAIRHGLVPLDPE